ncbi:MAG: FHA domain-containing protein [Deltaproteobacteria bacterium]|nr:FHA domain-containing protein [Deltaproteobacteria bacterium]
MAVRLTITELGDPASEYVRSFLQDRIVLGRARSADICLPDMAVSTRHAEINIRGSDYAIVDLGSLNGTSVDDVQLIAHRPRLLKNGDSIAIAGFRIRFSLGATVRPSSEPRDAPLRQAREILSRIPGFEEPVPTLVVVSGPSRANRFELPQSPANLIVGRGDEVDISIDDRDISRKHAEIVVESGGVFIRDLGSRNGLIVEGEQVEAVRLEPGNQFKLGKTIMALEHPADRSLNAIFEAPEEETSSFAVAVKPKTPSPEVSHEEDLAKDNEPTPEKEETVLPPPVGPADPLIDPTASIDRPLARTTGHILRPEIPDDRSDIGLIIVGAIIVVAAVAALVYLFG